MSSETDVTSLSSPPLRLRWDVFLSFRGEDTRHTITHHLYTALQARNVRVFRDNDGLTQGDSLDPILFEAIQDSVASIAIISANYASSRWCLEELARICEGGRLVLPVFYEVDPSDVRRQTGPFEEHFRKHETRYSSEVVRRWKNAMEKVGAKSGLVLQKNQFR